MEVNNKEGENVIILTGITAKGDINSKSEYYLGPDQSGKYKVVEIDKIICKKLNSKKSVQGQYCSLKLVPQSNIKKADIRKGMVLLDINSHPVAIRYIVLNFKSF